MMTSAESTPRAPRPWRLAYVLTHPIQYQAPLCRALAAHPDVDLTVFFAARNGTVPYFDKQFRRPVLWNMPLLEGYRHRFEPRLQLFGRPRSPWRFVNPFLPWHIARGGFDAVLVHGYATAASLLSWSAAAAARLPVLLRVESLPRARPLHVRLPKSLYLKAFFARTAAWLYTGEAAREFCLAYGAPEARLFHVPYAVDNARFTVTPAVRAGARRALGIAPDRCVVLYCAKLIENKRPLDMVRAVARAGDPRLTLLVAGEGELRRSVQAAGAAQEVDLRLLGFVNQAELPHVYAAADLLVLPSELETWGLVVNEAMAAGLPVLVSRRAGCARDLVREGENGRTFAPGDVETLAAHLRELAGDAERRTAWGRRSREIVERYSVKADVDGIVAALGATLPRACLPAPHRESIGSRRR